MTPGRIDMEFAVVTADTTADTPVTHTAAEYEAFLQDILSEGPVHLAFLMDGAYNEGLNYKGLQRAAARLGIVATGEMRARVWALPNANGQVSEWSNGQSSDDAGPGVPGSVLLAAALKGRASAKGTPPGHPRGGPGGTRGRGAKGQVSPQRILRRHDFAHFGAPHGWVGDVEGEVFRWTGEGPAPDEVKVASFGKGAANCGDCPEYSLLTGEFIVRVADEGWTHAAFCAAHLAEHREAVASAPPPSSEDRNWDGRTWRLVTDEGKDPPAIDNVSNRLAAIQATFEGGTP